MLEKNKLKCECGKEIIGFSNHHAKQNLEIHRLISKHHKEIMKGIKENIIDVRGMNIDEIGNLLENYPIMIEDIKEIGRVHEKKIMVS